ncbi:MAG: DUF4432 family protein [Candidatus Baltobacteraceae bacterium]
MSTLGDISRCLGRDDQLAGIREMRLENGVRAAYLRTGGGVDALIVLDRAMDIAWCNAFGIPVVWHGPGGILPAHPGTISDDAFERRFFGGLVTTCGLEAFGPAGSDAFGAWGTHGHINHIAAEECSAATHLNVPEPYIELRGVIRQARMFGESLRLQRTWSARIGGSELQLRDIVTNEGGKSVPHMVLYHCNAGYPLVSERAQVFISQSSMRARDAAALAGIDCWNTGGAPDPDFIEQVFIHEPQAIAEGWAVAAVCNEALDGGLGFAVHFRPEQLGACFSWRMLGTRAYVLAVEPANCAQVEGRIAAARAGTLPFLEPGESRTYDLRFEMLKGAGVARYAADSRNDASRLSGRIA